jgi:hypothetical protein
MNNGYTQGQNRSALSNLISPRHEAIMRELSYARKPQAVNKVHWLARTSWIFALAWAPFAVLAIIGSPFIMLGLGFFWAALFLFLPALLGLSISLWSQRSASESIDPGFIARTAREAR